MNEVTRLQAETIFLGQISWQQAATQLKNACKAGWGDLNEKIRKDLIARERGRIPILDSRILLF